MHELEFVEKLNTLNPDDDDLLGLLYDLTDQLGSRTVKLAVMPSIFRFLENNPFADIGSPGPLVHLIEELYPAYIPELLNSIERGPSPATLHMVNRILQSDLDSSSRRTYLDLLNSVANSTFINAQIADCAKEHCAFHQSLSNHRKL